VRSPDVIIDVPEVGIDAVVVVKVEERSGFDAVVVVKVEERSGFDAVVVVKVEINRRAR
jgi:hypothetical protein